MRAHRAGARGGDRPGRHQGAGRRRRGRRHRALAGLAAEPRPGRAARASCSTGWPKAPRRRGTAADLPFEAIARRRRVRPGSAGPLAVGRGHGAQPGLGRPGRARELERRLPDKRVFLENDVRAAALSEHQLGAGRGYDVDAGGVRRSGVGGGIVVDGQLYHGAHGGAGEIGHMVVRAGGPRCGCGRSGCLEAMAARDAVARYVIERGRARPRAPCSPRSCTAICWR